MAALVEILQQLHKTWQQQQGIDEDPNGQDSEALPVPESYSILPIPKALQTKFFRNQDGVIKDDTKRGSCKYSTRIMTNKSINCRSHTYNK
jgi:hypothetical protein